MANNAVDMVVVPVDPHVGSDVKMAKQRPTSRVVRPDAPVAAFPLQIVDFAMVAGAHQQKFRSAIDIDTRQAANGIF